MSATNQFEEDLLEHILENANAPNVGDATGLLAAGTAGSVQLSLHSAELDDADTDQTTDEVTTGEYGQYARQTVARAGAQWTISGGAAENANAIQFSQMTTGTGVTATYFGANLLGSGDFLQLWGELTGGGLAISNNITPEWAAGDFDITLD